MRVSVLPLLVCLSALPAGACYNDRDTDSLAKAGARLPETVQIITGRFERNPALYYSMRIERCRKELEKDPRQFNLYDDIAVAQDRLGNCAEALACMAHKRSLLPAYTPTDATLKEHWYRYYANTGTMRLVGWMRAGGPKSRLSELRQARREIARAIEIKPNAHFGREKYQLRAMDWMLQLRTAQKPRQLWEYMDEHYFDGYSMVKGWSQTEAQNNWDAQVKGIGGLIVLGAAWESPDFFLSLARTLQDQQGAALAYLATLRTRELVKSGHKSLSPTFTTVNQRYGVTTNGGPKVQDLSNIEIDIRNLNQLNALYPHLRSEADAWQAVRTSFMEEKLQRGVHPDTDPAFWEGYSPAPPPSLDVPWYSPNKRRYENPPDNSNRVKALLIVAVTTTGIAYFTLRIWSKRGK